MAGIDRIRTSPPPAYVGLSPSDRPQSGRIIPYGHDASGARSVLEVVISTRSTAVNDSTQQAGEHCQ